MRHLLMLLFPAVLAAQAAPTPAGVARERAAFTSWLMTSPRSPYAAVALETGRGGRITVRFGALRNAHAPAWYPFDPALVVTGTLRPAAGAERVRLLTLDGMVVEASEAGTFEATLNGGGGGGGTPLRLVVRRIPDAASEEDELTIYFRDATSGEGTYPAGRFVTLDPLGGNRYRLDFNGARNPFCAYSTVYPCPVPWAGNTLPVAIAAGERYAPSATGTASPPR